MIRLLYVAEITDLSFLFSFFRFPSSPSLFSRSLLSTVVFS